MMPLLRSVRCMNIIVQIPDDLISKSASDSAGAIRLFYNNPRAVMIPQLDTKSTEICNLSRSIRVFHSQQGTRSGKLKSITKPPKIKK